MLATTRGFRGIVTAPHHAASRAGLDILREGGSAVEAVVATAAVLAVVYPHMNSIGGDGFWLIAHPDRETPVGIDAAGRAAVAANFELYTKHGLSEIPRRGPLAANTVAGTISGWAKALAADHRGNRTLPLARLLRDAIEYADRGISITESTSQTIAAKVLELKNQYGFADVFLPGGKIPSPGTVIRQPALAESLSTLARDGLDSFYRGGLGQRIATELQSIGAPITPLDMQTFEALEVKPLHGRFQTAKLFNMPPPTQGMASLLILQLYERMVADAPESFAHFHRLIEATKRAFRIRARYAGEPQGTESDLQTLLDDMHGLNELATDIDPSRAQPWPLPEAHGDTVWIGAIDSSGQTVSMIQSTYFEFGSGIVLKDSGITWQNRGSAFRLAKQGPNRLRPGARPFHTLNPAIARFADGRTMAYGTMGGDGQPQTQAIVFTRYATYGQDLQRAVSAPRFLLGRTWGDPSTTLKVESRLSPTLIEALTAAGHQTEIVAAFDEMMGHAGAVVRHADGRLEGAVDPRSDGAVASF
jgi:gamma-glutamyltranspeptidase/glutathione hydrolase